MMPDAKDDMGKAADPFAQFGLDTLLSGAARLRPETLALADRDEMLSYSAFASRATALGHLFAEHGLKAGERVILCGGASTMLVVAMIAAIRAGIEPALAPIDLPAPELAAYARGVNAAAVVGVTRYGAFDPGELYLLAAADAPSVRLVATLGPGDLDGAVDLGAAAIKKHSTSAFYTGYERGVPSTTAAVRIFTLQRGAEPLPVMHRQSTLIAAGFDFVARSKMGRETAVLSTLPPVGFAALVAGPVSILLSGAALHFDGPFETGAFLSACARARRPHLIIPSRFGADFIEAGLTNSLTSLTLLSHMSAAEPFAAPAPLAAACPLIDLYAFDETAAVPEERRAGIAQQPAREPHHIGFENTKILAVKGMMRASGGIDLSGAAVSAAAA